jgi:predicted transcriptional regulator YdeE
MLFIHADGFTIIGIEARTSFRNEKDGGVFAAMWQRFLAEAMHAIPNRADSDLIALYTDYESDEFGEYTFVLGARVTSSENLPEGMVVRQIPAARCAVFTSERGPVKDVVINTWKRIWNEPRTAEYTRSYQSDYEVYGPAAADPNNCQIDIFIGVK